MPFLSPDLPEALYSGSHDFLPKSCRLYCRPTKLNQWVKWWLSNAGSVSDLVLLNDQGFSCQLCGKLFSDKSNCRRHVRETHQKMSQYACPFCSKALHRSKIQRHMSQCQGQWMLSMGLSEIHLHFWPSIYFPCFISICSGDHGHVTRTATGFACGFCCKEFVKGSNCRRHVKETHLSLGQFSCPYCNKNFHRSKVQNHINGCSGNANYS